jgi:hypothetical protein
MRTAHVALWPTTSMGGGILTPNGSAASIGEGTQ